LFGSLSAAQKDEKQNQGDRNCLRPNPPTHDLICMFLVKVATFAKGANAKQQNAQHDQYG